MPNLSRRQFVSAFAGVACAVTVRGVALAAPTSKPSLFEQRGFSAGPIDKIKKGFTDAFATSKFVVLVRTDDRIYAMSSACTHQGGSLKVRGDQLKCTRHAGAFDAAGKATHGPATGQLARYAITSKNGVLWVDPYTIILPGDFDKENAFVKVP